MAIYGETLTPEQQRAWSAIHEAGHVAMLFFFDQRDFARIEMTPNDTSLARVVWTKDAATPRAGQFAKRVAIYAGGMIATGIAEDEHYGEGDDDWVSLDVVEMVNQAWEDMQTHDVDDAIAEDFAQMVVYSALAAADIEQTLQTMQAIAVATHNILRHDLMRPVVKALATKLAQVDVISLPMAWDVMRQAYRGPWPPWQHFGDWQQIEGMSTVTKIVTVDETQPLST